MTTALLPEMMMAEAGKDDVRSGEIVLLQVARVIFLLLFCDKPYPTDSKISCLCVIFLLLLLCCAWAAGPWVDCSRLVALGFGAGRLE